jgi:hypothetical protein
VKGGNAGKFAMSCGRGADMCGDVICEIDPPFAATPVSSRWRNGSASASNDD